MHIFNIPLPVGEEFLAFKKDTSFSPSADQRELI